MRLFIAEKPSLARDIAEALGGKQEKGDGFIKVGSDTVTWCIGHVLKVKEPEAYNSEFKQWKLEHLPLNLFPLKLEPVSDKTKLVKNIIELIKNADEIVNAGDPDDEGQLLVDELLIYANNKKPVKRLWIKDPTPNGIKKALSNMKDNREYHSIYLKTLARQAGDLNFGLTMTRACTINAQSKGYKGVLSLGRVQTPMLGLIARRYLDNKEHKESFYYIVEAEFENGLKARLIAPEEFLKDDKGRMINEQEINQLIIDLKGKNGEVIKYELMEKETQPPLPFNLLKLQKLMNTKYKYTTAKTLEITQELREQYKAITYNRSDCQYLTDEQYNESPEILGAIKAINDYPLDQTIKSKAFNDANVSAHTAIIPTTSVPDLNKLSVEQRNVYEAIVKQYAIQFLPSKKYLEIKGAIVIDNRVFNFGATKTTDSGFLKYFNEIDEDKDDDTQENEELASNFDILEAVKINDSFKCVNIDQNKKKTTPLPIFTEATLMEALSRIANYVTDPKIKALLKAKDKDIKDEHGGIGTGATRSAILEILKKRNYITVEKNKLIPTDTGLAFLKSIPEETARPDLTALWTEQMNEIQEGTRTVEQFINSLENDLKLLLNKIDIQGLKIEPRKEQEQTILDTPCQCGGQLTIKAKLVVCDKCEFKVWRTIASKELTDNQLKELIEKGETKEIKGFKSKAGKSFGAKVTLEDRATGKTKFIDYIN